MKFWSLQKSHPTWGEVLTTQKISPPFWGELFSHPEKVHPSTVKF
nr:MAG TPA: hypothetical protein [Caudoviricetes sp.]DAH95952.1 MAG TPA: hypothetical protein [Caudoviricetes sp.]